MTTVRIGSRLIAEAERRGACSEALEWLREKPRTLSQLIRERRGWAVWSAVSLPLPDRVAGALQAAGCGRSWWRNGVLHRDDGPAVEHPDGGTEWRRHGRLHRDDGPAIERPNGYREWWRNGVLRRDGGPAIEYV